MENIRHPVLPHVKRLLREAVARMQPSVSFVSCIGILLSYLLGVYVTGSLHDASRWMGAMLACTSVVVVQQSGSYRESLRAGWIRVLGTFLGALVAYAYLSILPFSIVGMLASVFVLEMLSMLLGIYKNDRISTITLLIILLISQMTPHVAPLENCLLRFFESAVGVGIGVGLVWLLERWRKWRNGPQTAGTLEAAAGATGVMGVMAATDAPATATVSATTATAGAPGSAAARVASEAMNAAAAENVASRTEITTGAAVTPAVADAAGAGAAASVGGAGVAGGIADTGAASGATGVAGGSPKRVDMDTMPLRWGHFRVLVVASLGQITGAGLATLVGVILPMIQLVRHPALGSFQQGAVAATSLVGIMLGSLVIGAWSDKRGYLFFFRACPVLILIASTVAFFADRLGVLVPALLVMGIGIGGGYSLDSDYISEIMPRRWRLTMVGVAKAASALGNIAVAGISFYLLSEWRDPHLWNRLLLLIAVLALVMVLARIRFEQSPGWLIARGRIAEAERAVRYFLGPDVAVGEIRRRPSREQTQQVSWASLFRRESLRKVIFSGIPWACEGVGVYGIGVFLPVLILALGLEPASESAYGRIVRSVELTAWINCFILPGFVAGLLVVNRIYHVRTQTWGFVLAAAGLALLWAGWKLHLAVWVPVAGFMAFELFLNAGPHLMTFIIPPQIYSVTERGAGTGLAAAFGKAGAVVGVLFIPLLLGWGGAGLVLGVSIGVLLTGAAVTLFVGRKVLPDRGRSYRPEIRHAEPESVD